jgi:hypothetical protein
MRFILLWVFPVAHTYILTIDMTKVVCVFNLWATR